MKTLSFLLIILTLSLTVSACGGSTVETTPAIPADSSDEYDLNMKNAKLNLDLVE